MARVKIYRSGAPTPPLERGCEKAAYEAADALCPEGRQGRMTAIFAAPTLAGVTRWVRGNALIKQGDVLVRELTVEDSSVYVYSVRQWERVTNWTGRGWEGIEAYWASGLLLSEWLTRDLPADEWEVLVPASALLGVRPVSDKRVVAAEADTYYRDALARDLQLARLASRLARSAA